MQKPRAKHEAKRESRLEVSIEFSSSELGKPHKRRREGIVWTSGLRTLKDHGKWYQVGRIGLTDTEEAIVELIWVCGRSCVCVYYSCWFGVWGYSWQWESVFDYTVFTCSWDSFPSKALPSLDVRVCAWSYFTLLCGVQFVSLGV